MTVGWRLDPGEHVDVAARFTDYPGLVVLHCHKWDHEDHGVMAQFEVVAPPSAHGRHEEAGVPQP